MGRHFIFPVHCSKCNAKIGEMIMGTEDVQVSNIFAEFLGKMSKLLCVECFAKLGMEEIAN